MMELDESMDAFKKPTKYTARPVLKSKLGRKNTSRGQKRKTAVTPRQPSNAAPKSSDDGSIAGQNISPVLKREDTSDDDARPSKYLKVHSSKKKEYHPVDVNENEDFAQAYVSENGDLAKNCLTCGKTVRLSDFQMHMPACLRANYEACRRASGNENLRGSSTESASLSSDDYICPTCGANLFPLSEEKRNLHANRCLDNIMSGASCGESTNKVSAVPKNREKKTQAGHRCLVCAKSLKSSAGLKKHLVTCQKKNKFTTMTALTLHRPETSSDVDIEILAEIKRAEERETEVSKASTSVQKSPKKVRKRRPKKDPSLFEDGVYQLALAASNGDDLTSKKPKKQKEVLIPVMLTLSPNSKEKKLHDRMHRILGQVRTDDDDIPSTPGLPKSSLAISSIHAVGFLSGMTNNGMTPNSESDHSDDPYVAAGTSGRDDASDRLTSHRNVAEPQSSAQAVQQDVTPQPVGERELVRSPPSPTLLNTYLRPSRVSPLRPHENELQSPEVSSSNIKNSCLSDASDSPGRSYLDWPPADRQEREIQCDVSEQSDLASVHRPSKWTMTGGLTSSDCRVKGLLSQFERRHSKPCTSSEAVLGSIPNAPSLLSDDVAPEEDPDSRINCTLAELQGLDSAGFAESKNSSLDVKTVDQSPDGNVPPEESVGLAAPSQNTSNVSNTFDKLIDNSLYSDAKLVLGPDKEVMHIHKMILFCQCPALLQEIEMSRNNTLHLPEFSKKDVFPIMQYIYSNKVNVPSDGQICKKNIDKVMAIAKRFNVELPALSQYQRSQSEAEEQKDDTETNCAFADDVQDMEAEEDFMSQPSPTQKTPEDTPCPSPLPPPSPIDADVARSDDGINSDSDIFEFTDENCRSAVVSSSLPVLSTVHSEDSTHATVSSVPEVKTETEDTHADEVEDIIESDFDLTQSDPFEDRYGCLDIPKFEKFQVGGLEHEKVKSETMDSGMLKDDGVCIIGIPSKCLQFEGPTCSSNVPVDEPEASPSLPDLESNEDEYLPSENNSVISDFDLTQTDSVRDSNFDETEFSDSSQEVKNELASATLLRVSKTKARTTSLNDKHKHVTPRSKHGLRSSGRKRAGLKKCLLTCCQPNSSVDKYVREKLPRLKPRERMRPTISKLVASSQNSWLRRSSSSGTKLFTQSMKAKRHRAEIKATQAKSDDKAKIKRPYRRRQKAPDKKVLKEAVTSESGDTGLLHTPKRNRKPKMPLILTGGGHGDSKVPADSKVPDETQEPTSPDTPMASNSGRKGTSASKRGRKKSSEGLHKEETVYVSERLPRFKQREHIRNRPGVANMGKHGSKLNKSLKKEQTTPKSKSGRVQKVAQEDKRLSFSQPVQSTTEDNPEELNKNNFKTYKFKRMRATNLRDYAVSTPVQTKSKTVVEDLPHGSDSDSETEWDSYATDERAGLYSNIPFDDSFEEKCFQDSPCIQSQPSSATIPLVQQCSINTPVADTGQTAKCTGPVPITPMLNFNDMETPEIYRHAQKYGLKKSLGKAKLKAKFEEVYMYDHQTVSDGEGGADECEGLPANDVSMEEDANLHCSDDLTCDMQRWKLELTPLSAKPSPLQKTTDDLYSFATRTITEVSALSSTAVGQMHDDGTLLSALLEAKQETGSIKRGSRRDQERCWDIVTPGSSGYDPKVNAILSLPEECQSAITGPLVNCVVKNYIDYKKYMFDCLPSVCDRMEQNLT